MKPHISRYVSLSFSVVVRQNIKAVAVSVHLVGRDTLIGGRRTCSGELGAGVSHAQIAEVALQLRGAYVVPCHRRR